MTLILIDGNNSLYRFGFAMKKLNTSEGVPTGAIHGFLQMMLRLKRKYEDAKFIVAWDGRGYRSGWRAQVFPEYKGGRAKGEVTDEVKAIHEQGHKIKKICDLIGLTQTALDEVEADDIIGVLAAKYIPDMPVCIYSTDKDFIQLMTLGVTVIRDTGKQRLMPETINTVDVLFRCTPKDVLKIRSICGDSSDGIPGAMRGVGSVGASKAILAGADPANEKCKIGWSKFGEAWRVVHRNYRIMRILQSASDFELDTEQRRSLEREVVRIEAHLKGVVKAKRTETDFRALLTMLADLELQEAMENRNELWALNAE
jgi:5'-3' exonuclease